MLPTLTKLVFDTVGVMPTFVDQSGDTLCWRAEVYVGSDYTAGLGGTHSAACTDLLQWLIVKGYA